MTWWQFWTESVGQALSLLITFDTYVWTTIGVSLKVSGLALIFSILIAFPFAALLAYRQFPGRGFLRLLVYTGMGFPSVIVGLIVLLLLTQRGPLGEFQLLFTQEAMIIAQCVLIFPLLTGIAMSAMEAVDPLIGEAASSLGAKPLHQAWVMAGLAKRGLITAILSGFGRAISEVGAVMIVGGNILLSQNISYTRTLTTAIIVETRQGKFETALALGFILFLIVLIVNLVVLRLGRLPSAA